MHYSSFSLSWISEVINLCWIVYWDNLSKDQDISVRLSIVSIMKCFDLDWTFEGVDESKLCYHWRLLLYRCYLLPLVRFNLIINWNLDMTKCCFICWSTDHVIYTFDILNLLSTFADIFPDYCWIPYVSMCALRCMLQFAQPRQYCCMNPKFEE